MENIIPGSLWEFILTNLLEQLDHHYHLIKDAESNFHELEGSINTLKGFLEEYTKERYQQSKFIKSITHEAMRHVFEAENIWDTYIHSVLLHKAGLGSRHKLGEETAKLNRAVRNTHLIFAPAAQGAAIADNIYVGPPKKKEEDPSAGAGEGKIVGFDEDADIVIELLKKESENSNSEQLSVVSITGIFGRGKTTLAKKVLKDPRTVASFPDRAFVRVSEDYSKTEVFQDILRAFIPLTQEIKDMDEDQLAKNVEEELKKRKYLIVLDNIWSENVWDAIQGALPKQKGSVVLITTREQNIAFHAHPFGTPHQPYPLTSAEAKDLLLLKAGLRSSNFDANKNKYISKILDKCGGLPLRIVIIAGILQGEQDNIDWWKTVSEDVDCYVQSDPKHKGALRLSYDRLPFHLKQCFLYLGVFHEGSEIPAQKILRLWIAEGFISPCGSKSLVGIAKKYLKDLIDRNLVMASQRRIDGQVKTCLIHCELHRFCRDEAVEENLFREKLAQEATNVNPSPASYRRLSIRPEVLRDTFSQQSQIPDHEYVRSCLSFAKEDKALPQYEVSSGPKGFKLLKVLDIKSISFPSFPPELVKLVLLKYIATYCQSTTLPSEMSNLSYLQTLIFETSSPTLEVKANIWKMLHLSHLQTNSSIVQLQSPGNEYQGESSQGHQLETLCVFRNCSALVHIPSDLGKITSLQKIELYDPTPSLDESATKIEKLKLTEKKEFELDKHFTAGSSSSGQIPSPQGSNSNQSTSMKKDFLQIVKKVFCIK